MNRGDRADGTDGPHGPVLGVPEAFPVFYRREVPAVLALTMSLTRRPGAAEDVAQEAFLRAWRDWDRVGRFDHPGAWVRRVAVNQAMSRFRRLRAEATAVLRLGPAGSAHDPDPEDEALWRAVRRLPRRQAQAIALAYVDGMTAAEAGEVLGIEPATVRAHLTRARRTLADRLGEEWRGEEQAP